jgi:MFS family permease
VFHTCDASLTIPGVNFRTLTLAVLSLSLVTSLGGTLLGLFVDSTEAWRLAGTAMILTVMSGIWAVATRGGDSGTTPVVLTTVIGSGASAAWFCAAVWLPIGTVFEGCMGSGAACLGATVAGAFSMRVLAFPLAVRGAWVAFGLQMAALLAWFAAAWSVAPVIADFGLRGWQFMIASPIAFMVCFGDPRERGATAWQVTGLSLLGIALVIWLGIANGLQQPWNLDEPDRTSMERQGAVAVLVATFALAIGMGRVFRHARGGRWARALHLATVGLVLMEGALLFTYIALGWRGDLAERVLVAMIPMIVSGGAISAVLDRMARAIKAVSVADLKDLQCDCPRCKHRQRIPVDGRMHPCARCGLGFSIVLSQRQCFACSYDLSGSLGAVTCPECGAPVVTQPLALVGAVPPPPVADPSSAA